jgi:hypothetical protein
MPSSKGAKGGTKESIHFVNARPTSENEKLRIQRLVRAHVGKWISDQTKDRSAGESSDSNSNREEPRNPASQVEIDTEETLFPSSSSPSAGSSRESPESTTSRSLSLSIHSASLVHRPSVAYSHAQEPLEDDAESHCQYNSCRLVVDSHRDCTCSPGQDTASFAGYTMTAMGSDVFDPFHTYPSHYTPESINACERYC